MTRHALLAVSLFGTLLLAGCSRVPEPSDSDGPSAAAAPPPEMRAWMDRLTVAHEYDPATGFIVARETVSLPPLLAEAPALDAAIAQAGADLGNARTVIAFATADRCAPCQQYKRDALNDAAVIAKLSESRFLPTHLEVDRASELAEAIFGTRAIPMTYALRGGKVVAELRGQRSAAELIAWLEALTE